MTPLRTAVPETGAALPQVVLHQWEISPFCGKVRKILQYKGIPYRIENYHGVRALKVRKLSPTGQLPVLDWGPQRIQDSTRIAAFVEQCQPAGALYPRDPVQAALARLLEDWSDESLYPYEVYFRSEYAQARQQATRWLCSGRATWEHALMAPIFTRRMRRQVDAWGLTRRSGAEIEASFLRIVDDLDTLLQDREWLVGDRRSIADFAVSAQLDEVMRTSPLSDRLRLRVHVARWLAALAC